MQVTIKKKIEQARSSKAYQNYLQIRPLIIRMLDEAEAYGANASDYWEEELRGFEYMFDASPLIIDKLREHCYHITGLQSYSYRKHHAHKGKRLEKKLRTLKAVDTKGIYVPEAHALGGFGYDIDGGLYNIDTLKFYESLIALSSAGVLDYIRNSQKKRSLVVEIGSGWGGFAYQLKTILPEITYVCVDLPQSLMLAAVYLMTIFPESKSRIYGNVPNDQLFAKLEEIDFIFLPHYVFKEIETPPIDVAVNMVSFQEMTETQVDHYAQALSEKGCKTIYSHNRDRSPHNKQLERVSDILSKYFELSKIHVLDVPYTKLEVSEGATTKYQTIVKNCLKKILPIKLISKKQNEDIHEYRHLIGKLKKW